jgi:putative Holliday junction resolvase
VGNSLTETCQALTVLKARDGIPDWREVELLLKEWQPGLMVVGNPLNMDDSESELSRLAQKFGRRLAERFGLPLEFADERLSSFEAKQQLQEEGHRGDYRREPADSLAAKLILESWFRSGN